MLALSACQRFLDAEPCSPACLTGKPVAAKLSEAGDFHSFPVPPATLGTPGLHGTSFLVGAMTPCLVTLGFPSTRNSVIH